MKPFATLLNLFLRGQLCKLIKFIYQNIMAKTLHLTSAEVLIRDGEIKTNRKKKKHDRGMRAQGCFPLSSPHHAKYKGPPLF